MSAAAPPTRRDFLRRTACASAGVAAFPYVVPERALGEGVATPNARINLGFIGTGGRGNALLWMFLRQPDVQVVAVSDVDQGRMQAAQEKTNKFYAEQRGAGTYKGCAAFSDYRELLARQDIDAVCIATPDHWHALASTAAAKAGKDIYCEKPLANSIGEGRAICNAVKKYGRVFQTGSHERSNPKARFAAELVRNGKLGKLHTVRINLPCADGHHQEARKLTTVPPPEPVPAGFDYDTWLGHTPVVPYTPKRCHFWWRFILTYGGGEMTDRGAHVIDLAQLAAGTDGTGPTEVKATGVQTPGSLYDTFWDYQFENVFADGLRFVGEAKGPRGLKLEGDEGWLFIHVHGCKLEAEPASLLEEKIPEDGLQLGRAASHQRNFLDAVQSREAPFAHAEIGHHTATLCHLNNLAMKLGRSLKWDPVKEVVVGDEEATGLLMPKMRPGWALAT